MTKSRKRAQRLEQEYQRNSTKVLDVYHRQILLHSVVSQTDPATKQVKSSLIVEHVGQDRIMSPVALQMAEIDGTIS